MLLLLGVFIIVALMALVKLSDFEEKFNKKYGKSCFNLWIGLYGVTIVLFFLHQDPDLTFWLIRLALLVPASFIFNSQRKQYGVKWAILLWLHNMACVALIWWTLSNIADMIKKSKK